MKKSISIILIAMMTTMLFSGFTLSRTASAKSGKLEIVNGKFIKKRKITVEVYDRGNTGGSKPENNFFTNWIKEGMLRDHNVEVTFKPVPRWTEVQQINNLLAAGSAPDICLTYDYPTVQTYANMGGVLDLNPILNANKALLPNLYNLLTETNINWDKDPTTGTIWAIEARLQNSARISTFVREDWLKKLNLKEPTNINEFEAVLKAFKNNAKLLLGNDAAKMVPFSIGVDVGWRADHLLASFVPSKITQKDIYVNGFDDRHLLFPGIKAGVKKLNQWYNEGLIWKDFPLYKNGDPTEDNMMKAGYVGAFIHNWDYPYRNGVDSINNNIKKVAGADAGYVAVECFKNDAGKYAKFLSPPIDRKVFLPATNKEPLASLLYLDWISKTGNYRFIQTGVKGTNYDILPDGAIKTKGATGKFIMNSPLNIDYTMTMNGLNLGKQDLTLKSMALGYVGTDSSVISKAYKFSIDGGIIPIKVSTGPIKSEEGMGPTLSAKRDVLLTQSVVAPANKFDSTFDSGLKDYLSSGGQAIIDERTAAWNKINKK